MKIKGLYIFILIMSTIPVVAQNEWFKKIPEVDSVFAPVLTGNYFIEKRNIIGDQYLNSRWTEGTIKLSTDEMVQVKSLKYNGLYDELVWMNNLNLNTFKIDKAFIKEFWLKDFREKELHFRRIVIPVTTPDTVSDMLAEVLTEGRYCLYKQHSITLQWPQYKVIDKVRVKYDVLRYSPFYLIKTPDGQIIRIDRISKKNVLKHLPDEENRINDVLRKEDFSLRKEADIIKLINLMNL